MICLEMCWRWHADEGLYFHMTWIGHYPLLPVFFSQPHLYIFFMLHVEIKKELERSAGVHALLPYLNYTHILGFDCHKLAITQVYIFFEVFHTFFFWNGYILNRSMLPFFLQSTWLSSMEWGDTSIKKICVQDVVRYLNNFGHGMWSYSRNGQEDKTAGWQKTMKILVFFLVSNTFPENFV